ncbi:MAG: hypothetical protein ACTSWN_14645 [Promethearchaeota archaeon]
MSFSLLLNKYYRGVVLCIHYSGLLIPARATGPIRCNFKKVIYLYNDGRRRIKG